MQPNDASDDRWTRRRGTAVGSRRRPRCGSPCCRPHAAGPAGDLRGHRACRGRPGRRAARARPPGDAVRARRLATSPASSCPPSSGACGRPGYQGHVDAFINLTLAKVWRQHERFDVIHSHLETGGFLFARLCPTPVVTTLHGRLDHSGMPELLEEFTDIPLVAISDSQRRWSPEANWVATIHHGLPLERLPFSDQPGSYLAFVGRVTPEKGIAGRHRAGAPDAHAAAHGGQGLRPARARALRRGRRAGHRRRASSSSSASSVRPSATRSTQAPSRR